MEQDSLLLPSETYQLDNKNEDDDGSIGRFDAYRDRSKILDKSDFNDDEDKVYSSSFL